MTHGSTRPPTRPPTRPGDASREAPRYLRCRRRGGTCKETASRARRARCGSRGAEWAALRARKKSGRARARVARCWFWERSATRSEGSLGGPRCPHSNRRRACSVAPASRPNHDLAVPIASAKIANRNTHDASAASWSVCPSPSRPSTRRPPLSGPPLAGTSAWIGCRRCCGTACWRRSHASDSRASWI